VVHYKKNTLVLFALLPLIFFPSITPSKSIVDDTKSVAEQLGWVSQPETEFLCGGTFVDHNILMPESLKGKEDVIDFSADHSSYSQEGPSKLSGNVTITRAGQQIMADSAVLKRDPKTQKFDRTEFTGQVVLREPGKVIIGENGHVKLNKNTGAFDNVKYRVYVGAEIPSEEGGVLYGLSAWGEAGHVNRRQSGIYVLRDSTYTTCAPDINSWKLSATKITLNQDEGWGDARHVKLKVKNVPVLYIPYFNFPLDKRRKSGVLFPTYGETSESGVDISVPIYLNLAPNYDATITPRLMTKRGEQLNGVFRYLTQTSEGRIKGSYLKGDDQFNHFQKEASSKFSGNPSLNRLLRESTDRELFGYRNKTKFNQHWFSKIDYNYVSDDYYFQDFGGSLSESTNNQLIRTGDLNYQGESWDLFARLQSYQTLHPVNQVPTDEQYKRLPQLGANAEFPHQAYGMSYHLASEFVNFDRNRSPGESNDDVVKGQRYYLEPGISWPAVWMSGYVTPSVKLSSTQYELHNQQPGKESSITRVLPIASVDAGMFFDRDVKIFDRQYQQTLEPRAYYLYVPHDGQKDIPVFDSSIQTFTFDQLFRDNRFSGVDRIGDANQISFALTSRALESDSGFEKFRISLGEIFYFRDREVTLCDTPGCSDRNITVGATSRTASFSPIVGDITYSLNRHWSARVGTAWDPESGAVNNGYTYVQYKPSPEKIINLGYNFVRSGDVIDINLSTGLPDDTNNNNLNQVDLSFAWPLHKNWNAMGRWNYNLSHHHLQTYFYGLEYDSCCWALRFVGARTYRSLNERQHPVFENNFYIQFLLKGLGALGSEDPHEILTKGIRGYTDYFE